MIETDGLPMLFVNNFYGDDENSNRRKEQWSHNIIISHLLNDFVLSEVLYAVNTVFVLFSADVGFSVL